MTFSQKLPVGTGEVKAKNPLPGCPCWYFFMQALFWLSWARRKSIDFGKNYEKLSPMNSSTTLQPTYIIQYLLHMDWTQGLTMLVFPSHAASWRVASSFTLTQEIRSKSSVRPGCTLDGSCKTALTHCTSPYAACILVLFIIACEWFLQPSLARPAIRSSFRSFFLPEFSFKC